MKKKLHAEDGAILKVDFAPTPEEGFLSCKPKPPFPFHDNSITLLSAAHIIEKIPRDAFIPFMDECWRVLKFNGQMRLAAYYAGSTPFWSDPLHVNGTTVQTWSYFDPLQYNGALYRKYKPKPWKVESVFSQVDNTMEVLLSKRRPDKSYEK